MQYSRFICFCCGLSVLMASANDTEQLVPLLEKIRAVESKGTNHQEAVAATKALQKASISSVPQILAAMDQANPLAQNWLRGIAESVVEKTPDQVPKAALETFLRDTKHSPRGRRLAYEFLLKVDPTVEQRILANMVQDPSLELRRDAVQLVIDQGEANLKAGRKPTAIEAFRSAFLHARDLDQIQALAKKLKELEQTYDMPTRMGFLMRWKIVGPFDNINDLGWDTAYEPETKLDFAAEYPGKSGAIKWIEHETKDEFGLVDLTTALDKHKGAIAYVATDFISDREQPVVLRLGCINAHKVWLNGQQVGANHVYHAGIEIDQYTFPVQLKAGKNQILLKVCQNEQTEPWAQRWQFQLRVSDEIGGAVLSQDRLVPKTAAR
jgi:tetratricopeptide (TPR) repeat protein